MNITLNLDKGEQFLIYCSRYRKFPDCIKSYRVNVKKVEHGMATIIDLNDRNIEKSFWVHRVLEVINEKCSTEVVEKKLKWHRDNFFKTYQPITKFNLAKGLPMFRKKCSGSYHDGTISMDIINYPPDINRDIHVFSFLCAILKDNGDFNLNDCKQFTQFAAAVFPKEFEEMGDDYFKSCFDKDSKDDYLSLYKENIENIKFDIQEVKTDKDIEAGEKEEELHSLNLDLEIAKEKLVMVKKDLRGMLVEWFSSHLGMRHDSHCFSFLEDIFDVMDFRSINGNEFRS